MTATGVLGALRHVRRRRRMRLTLGRRAPGIVKRHRGQRTGHADATLARAAARRASWRFDPKPFRCRGR
jgi:hypothetical protein